MLNIDLPTSDELRTLAELRGPAVVSIYLPTTPITADAQADRIELKNLAEQARAALEQAGVASKAEVAEIDEELADLVVDDDFWEHQAQGLAVTEVTDAARAASAGAVDTLVVDKELFVPGTVDDDGTEHDPETAPGQVYGVVDEIARRVLLTGGTVLSVDATGVPGGRGFAAILSYPW